MDEHANTTATTEAAAPAAESREAPAVDTAAQDASDLAAFKAVKGAAGDMGAARRTFQKNAAAAPSSSSPSHAAGSPAKDGGEQPSGGTDAPEGGDQEEIEDGGEEVETDEADEGEQPAAKGGDKKKGEPTAAEKALAGLKTPQRIEYVQAEAALKRDGLEDAEIADLIAGIGIDKTIKQGLKRRDAQKRQDLAWSKRRGSADPAPSNGTGKPGARNPAPHADAADPDDTGEENEGAHGDADPLDEELEGLTPAQKQAARKRIDDANKRAEKAEAARTRDLLVGTVDRLTADFPKLSSVEGQRQVLEQMNELDPTGAAMSDRAKLEALMRKASWAVFGPSIQTNAREARRADAHAALDGQPSVPRTSGKAKPALTTDEYEDKAYRAVKDAGGDESVARRQLAKR